MSEKLDRQAGEVGADAPPLPESEITSAMLAAALYDALDENDDAFVSGDPRDGWETTIDGHWDLTSIAVRVLALMRKRQKIES
jgi:hypothetical protein